MNNNDNPGKQRRGSSPAPKETQEAFGHWVKGHRLAGQKTNHQIGLQPDTGSEDCWQAFPRTSLWRDDGGEGG